MCGMACVAGRTKAKPKAEMKAALPANSLKEMGIRAANFVIHYEWHSRRCIVRNDHDRRKRLP